MKRNEASVFVFIASMILGILITSNFSFNRKTTRVVLNSKQYQEKYSIRNTLISDVDKLKNKYVDLLNKISKFSTDKDENSEEDEINEELNNAKILTGISNVEGPGVTITVSDGTDVLNGVNVTSQDDNSKIIHQADMLKIMNELKVVGAEAVCINDQRVISSSEFICDGPFLMVNGAQLASPFYINAIGDKEKLYDYINSDNNYFNVLRNRGISIKIKKQDNIKILGYSGKTAPSYLKNKN